MSIREVVTIQVGHFSNFVGTHWWNLQEASFIYDHTKKTDISHDVLFQEGLSNGHVTFNPRLLAIDLKGSLRTLPTNTKVDKELPQESLLSTSAWTGSVELISHEVEEKNEFLKQLDRAEILGIDYLDSIALDSKCPDVLGRVSNGSFDLAKNAHVWSDFLRASLHPQSIYVMDDCWHQDEYINGVIDPNWNYNAGLESYCRIDVQDEIVDRIRRIVEPCDSLQGFQFLTDTSDGLAGVGSGILEHLFDEFNSKDKFTFLLTPPNLSATSAKSKINMIASIVQTYAAANSYSSLVFPLNLQGNKIKSDHIPHLSVDAGSWYEMSGLFSCFLDTFSSCYRFRDHPLFMSYLSDVLAIRSHKFAGCALALPVGLEQGADVVTSLQQISNPTFVSLTDEYDTDYTPVSKIMAFRGLPEQLVSRLNPGREGGTDHLSEALCHLVNNSSRKSTVRLATHCMDALATSVPFPNILSKEVTNAGFINKKLKRQGLCNKCPSASLLCSSENPPAFLKNVLGEAMALVPAVVTQSLGLTDDDAWHSSLEMLISLLPKDALISEDIADDAD